MDDGTLAGHFVAGDSEIDFAAEDSQSNASLNPGVQAPVPSFIAAVPSRPVVWLRLVRPSSLLLVLVPALTALALLWVRGAKMMALPALAGLLSLVLVQAGASLLDVYLEYARRAHLPESERNDQMTARALLAHSSVSPMGVLRVSILLLILGAIVGIPLIVTGGWPVAVLGLVGLTIAFLFSATTIALKRFSLSDVIIALALGPGVVAGMMLAQRHTPTGRDLLFAVALGLLAVLPAEGAHLRDAKQDAALGRSTLVTALGDRAGRAVYLVCLLAAYALLAVAALPQGAPHGALLAFFALPSFAIPASGALLAAPGYAREQVVMQELRAYAIFGFWLLLGLAVNAILISGLGPIPPTL
jgi:1,4-dihydroxy-2-naphthoate polyprenyltransferase